MGHRDSEDLDFFSLGEISEVQLKPFRTFIQRRGYRARWEVQGPRFTAFLLQGRSSLKVDFSYYPYSRIEKGITWNGLSVDSVKDIAVNKIEALATRFEPKDFVDLFCLHQRYPGWQLDDLRRLARLKFDVTVDPFSLGARLMRAREIKVFPPMHIPFSQPAFQKFFLESARSLSQKK